MNSLKSLLLVGGITLVVVGLMASIFISYSFSSLSRQHAENNLKITGYRLADEVLTQWQQEFVAVANVAAGDEALKKVAKSKGKQEVVAALDGLFAQGAATLGVITLERTTLFDKKFTQILGQSSIGKEEVVEPPSAILEKLAARSGKERYKIEVFLWQTPAGIPMATAVAPIGLPIKAYVMMHSSMADRVLPLSEKLDVQIKVNSLLTQEPLVQSEMKIPDDAHKLMQSFVYPKENPVMQVQLVKDNSALVSSLHKVLALGVTSYILLMLLALGALAWILKMRILNILVVVRQRVADTAEGKLHSTDIKTNLKDEIGQVGHAVNAMSTNLGQLVSNIHAASNELTDVVNVYRQSWSEITEATQSIAENVSLSAEKTKRAKGVVEDGGQVIGQLRNGFDAIENASNNSTSDVQALAEESGKILDIVRMINDIADQTNLLALNAAIEAARAGDAGRGFAVVADEVRKLAHQTTSATSTVTETVNSLIELTEKTTTGISDVFEAVQKGREQLKTTEDLLMNIVDQTSAIDESVTTMAVAAEEQASITQENASKIDRISSVADELTEHANFFKVID